MDGAAEGTKKRRTRRGSDKGEEAEGADPPKVKQEERPDAGKQEVPKRRAEQRDSMESKRKAAVAAPQQEAVVARATSLAKENKPMDNHSESESSEQEAL